MAEDEREDEDAPDNLPEDGDLDEDDDEFDPAAAGEDQAADTGGRRKKLVLLVALGALLLVLGGAVGLYLTGVFDSLIGAGETAEKPDPNASLTPSVYHEMPEMLVDLKTGSCRAPFLKLKVQLELTDKTDVKVLEEAQPHIMDRLQTHLRTLERQDLVGREGAERLRLDIIRIINNTARPAKVRDVLFKEFLLQ